MMLLITGGLRADEQSAAARWRTLETAHVRIHYPEPFEPWALRAATRVDAIFERVADAVGHGPDRRVDVLVMDPAADANGMALPFLDRPAIVLWTQPPPPESSIGHYSDWTDLLVTHEMGHIAHLTRVRHRSRRILERLSPVRVGPLALRAPRWVTEGYATLIEGELTGSGRPDGAFRAMVLRQFAMEGKLPSYGALSGTSGWLGGSMAYLVGSSYLSWLEERGGKDSLPRLWKRIASRRAASFPEAFAAIFGEAPGDLYARFVAETTAQALGEETRLRAAGLVEGERWQRLRGATSFPEVSPDGAWLLARREGRRGTQSLVIWSIAQTPAEKTAEEERAREEAEIAKDPEEVVDKRPEPGARAPIYVLRERDGSPATSPRFLRDARVLFVERVPDGEGVLHGDLFVWDPKKGGVDRVTHRADVVAADPAPDGRWAAAVVSHHGATKLVAIDLGDGTARELTGESIEPPLAHPRVSPSGASIACLVHRDGAWRLALHDAQSVGAGKELPTDGAPVGPPAWSPDGKVIYVATDRTGIWNIEAIAVDGGAAPARITRVTGGALAPAISPDGSALFFLDLTAKGIDLRRLALPAPAVSGDEGRGAMPVVAPEPGAPRTFDEREAPPAHAYRVGDTLRPRAMYGLALGPDGASVQGGVQASDILGRFDLTAFLSAGDRAGPWGGSIAAAWRGWPVAVGGQAFYARERPGDQRLAARPALDQDRVGVLLQASLSRQVGAGRFAFAAGAGGTRVTPDADGAESFTRALGFASAEVHATRSRGSRAIGFDLSLGVRSGRTGGLSWTQSCGTLSARGSVASFWGRARIMAGTTSGDPTAYDLFAIGGSPAVILPPEIDRNRIDVPALPEATIQGEHLEAARVDLGYGTLPVAIYAERLWAFADRRGDPVTVAGIEARADASVLPIAVGGRLEAYAGVARVTCDTPELADVTAYAGLSYRP